MTAIIYLRNGSDARVTESVERVGELLANHDDPLGMIAFTNSWDNSTLLLLRGEVVAVQSTPTPGNHQ